MLEWKAIGIPARGLDRGDHVSVRTMVGFCATRSKRRCGAASRLRWRCTLGRPCGASRCRLCFQQPQAGIARWAGVRVAQSVAGYRIGQGGSTRHDGCSDASSSTFFSGGGASVRSGFLSGRGFKPPSSWSEGSLSFPSAMAFSKGARAIRVARVVEGRMRLLVAALVSLSAFPALAAPAVNIAAAEAAIQRCLAIYREP